MCGNFIKIDRKIIKWEWWSDINTFRVFVYMLISAYWKDGNYKGKPIKRGSFPSSISELARETNLTDNEIRTTLKHLKSTGEITSKSNNKFTVFTVNNYDLYQAINEQNNKQIASNNTNKSQAINKPLTSTILKEYKEEKEKKEIKNNNIGRFTPPDVSEVQAYCFERNNNVDAQAFVDFYSSKGWMVGKNKMKDWKAAVRTWERGNERNKNNSGPIDWSKV